MTTTRYAVIVGVNLEGVRTPALELGPFVTATDALTAGADTIGRTMRAVEHRAILAGVDACPYYEHRAAHAVGAGFTVERFDDQTDSSWEIHGNARDLVSA